MFARCINHKRTVSNKNRRATIGRLKNQTVKGVMPLAMSAAADEYRVAARHDEPDDAENKGSGPAETQQKPDIGSDPFAALKFQPDRKEMAEERAKRSCKRGVSTKMCRREDGNCALEHVANERRCSQPFVTGA